MDELRWKSYPLAASVKVRVILFRECDNKVTTMEHIVHGGEVVLSRRLRGVQ